jgi:hypothetical protein
MQILMSNMPEAVVSFGSSAKPLKAGNAIKAMEQESENFSRRKDAG